MSTLNKEQIDYWNGRAGEKWSALQARFDGMLANVTTQLVARAGSVAGLRVLDIGCGTGETCTIWLQGGAEVTGVDVSVPMLSVARSRTRGKATLVEADASGWKGDRFFDLAVSRFGVMFFDDPVAAFANIATNIRPGGRMLFACWREAAENHWMSTPMNAIRDLLPESPVPLPHAPGPFALADKERLAGILSQAGFTHISIEPFDCTVVLANKGGVEEAVYFAMQMGPASAALAESSEEVRAQAAKRLEVALAPFNKEGAVTMDGAIWIVEAFRAE